MHEAGAPVPDWDLAACSNSGKVWPVLPELDDPPWHWCHLQLLLALALRDMSDGPLFHLENGLFLTRVHFVTEVRSLLQAVGVDSGSGSGSGSGNLI